MGGFLIPAHQPLCLHISTLLRTNKEMSHLGVRNRQGIDPDPPPSPLIFDGVVEKNPEDVVHHLSYLLLFWVLWVDVSEGEHPVLPDRALQQAAGAEIQTYINTKINSNRRQNEFHFKHNYPWTMKGQAEVYRRFSRLLLKSLIMSVRKSLLTSISSALGLEFFRRVATTFNITEKRRRRGEKSTMKE